MASLTIEPTSPVVASDMQNSGGLLRNFAYGRQYWPEKRLVADWILLSRMKTSTPKRDEQEMTRLHNC